MAGSVRMVYAIIYSLLLGFGITIGTAIYGLMDVHAVTPTSCSTKMPKHYHFMFVPLFTLWYVFLRFLPAKMTNGIKDHTSHD